MRHSFVFLLVLPVYLFSCRSASPPVTTTVHYQSYKITPQLRVDTSLVNFLKPYGDSLHQAMGQVIGFASEALYKKQPESGLGNLMADAIRVMAAEKYNMPVDAAVMNEGAIRSSLSAGNVTVEKVYELMPFDNLLVLQQLKGAVLQQFLDRSAEKGGWPLSGITMKIRNRKAVEVLVGGKPLDTAAVYTVANSDYLANGGDNCDMLRPVPQINKGYLFRDALIAYFRLLTARGKSITGTMENRVQNVN